jgi:transcriptional regulator with XRE-family HTH domain
MELNQHEIGVKLNTGTLRRDMYARGWQQKDLAHAANLSNATVSEVMRGRPASLKTLTRIADALEGCPPRDDLGRLL